MIRQSDLSNRSDMLKSTPWMLQHNWVNRYYTEFKDQSESIDIHYAYMRG